VSVSESESCIEWRGYITWDGYGQTYSPLIHRQTGAHRWVWSLLYGPIPAGLVLLHSCDNRRCVNLNHLRLGTQKENVADMTSKGRAWWQIRDVPK